MRAITVAPGRAGSASLSELDEPRVAPEQLLVESLAVGVCGTDREILAGDYGEAPPGETRLVIGHESLGRVLRAPRDGEFRAGDLVAGVVRRPDPEPCRCCAAGEWDMCRNGRYTERGIKQLDGFAAERFGLDPAFAVRIDPALEDVGVLVEPASVVAKAWEQIDYIRARACAVAGGRLLVVGAGPIGLLAALFGVQRGYEVHVLDIVEEGPKPGVARALGATYHVGAVAEACPDADVVVEASGAPSVVVDAMANTGPNAIVCLTGVPGPAPKLEVDVARLNRELVMENDVVFGSVNANRRHYAQAAGVLAATDPEVLRAMITRRVALDDWPDAFAAGAGIKSVIDFSLGARPLAA